MSRPVRQKNVRWGQKVRMFLARPSALSLCSSLAAARAPGVLASTVGFATALATCFHKSMSLVHAHSARSRQARLANDNLVTSERHILCAITSSARSLPTVLWWRCSRPTSRPRRQTVGIARFSPRIRRGARRLVLVLTRTRLRALDAVRCDQGQFRYPRCGKLSRTNAPSAYGRLLYMKVPTVP